MRNIFIEIEYLGTNYFGFQIQSKKDKKEITIQGVIEDAIYKLLGERIRIVYAGRTDRGVHAKSQGINFKTTSKISIDNIKKALNSLLPKDIRIKKIKEVALSFHSRFWVNSKVYRYIILNAPEPSVFWNSLSWHLEEKLDIDLMKKAASKIEGKRDFYCFAKDASHYKDCIRNVMSISIKKKGLFIYIDVKGDGFLRGMVRNITAELVKVALKQMPISDIPKIIKRKIPHANKPAPAYGLYLKKLNY